jgi:hypothetical protein
MKDRSILMSGPMVRALLDGRKTQTRLGVKGNHDAFTACHNANMGGPGGGRWWDFWSPGLEYVNRVRCPYGVQGDLLWLRESWCASGDRAGFAYMADHPGDPKGLGWRPSIHMPRWASRLTLRITEVRVERLQDISKADADAECFGGDFPESVLPEVFPRREGGWGPNPWVWALSFEVIPRNIEAA